MQIKMRADTAKTEINATREKVNGKRLILQKTVWRSLAGTG